jgi:hypothetical protein
MMDKQEDLPSSDSIKLHSSVIMIQVSQVCWRRPGTYTGRPPECLSIAGGNTHVSCMMLTCNPTSKDCFGGCMMTSVGMHVGSVRRDCDCQCSLSCLVDSVEWPTMLDRTINNWLSIGDGHKEAQSVIILRLSKRVSVRFKIRLG